MSGTGNTALDAARDVADAVLLEGYVLYPYRASAPKNQVRWQFGVLAPPGASSSEPSHSQTECLIEPPDKVSIVASSGERGAEPCSLRTAAGNAEPGDDPALEVTVRFLQVQARTGQGADAVAWDEAVVREVPVTARLDPSGAEHSTPFQIDGGEDTDGATVRRRWPLSGVVRLQSERMEGPYGAWKVRVRVENQTPCEACVARTEMLRRSLVSAHTLLHLPAGVFISLLEPPEWAAPAAASCDNQHTWPVLVGEGRRDVMLSSPIILYDYPEIAGESPANLHDSTEIDELLMLRTMTLTDEEKAEARATDQRSADIIDRADHLPPEIMERLHGAIRYLRGPEAAQPGGPGQGLSADGIPEFREPGGPGQDSASPVPHSPGLDSLARAADSLPGGGPDDSGVPWWDPGADSSVSPETDRVPVPGGWASKGAKVRLWPGRTDPGPVGSPVMRRTDAQDMFADGRTATVQAVFHDVDGSSHLAVTLDDDPAAELHQWFGRYQYFSPSEVELVGEDTPGTGEGGGRDSGSGADAGGPR